MKSESVSRSALNASTLCGGSCKNPIRMVAIGLAIGLGAAWAGGRSALSGYLPARRASRVDPIVALRYE